MDAKPFRLDQDLLWQIFYLVADMESDEKSEEKIPALLTLRHSSQVCSSWRDIILSNTSWWARTLNIKQLNQKSDGWRTEVLRRTGQSLLHIKGIVPRKHLRFMEAILTENWERIRVLRLLSYDDSNSSGLVLLLQRPAPCMEVFEMSPIFDHDHLFASAEFRLFAHSAPSLRVFHSFTSNIEPLARAPFIAHLRKLHLMFCWTTPRQLLSALAKMHFLEDFVGSIVMQPDHSTSSFPVATLPHLKRISIRGPHTHEWLDVLSNIMPAVKCALNMIIQLQDNRLPLTVADISAASRIISLYSHRHLHSQKKTKLHLRFWGSEFEAWLHTNSADLPSPFYFLLAGCDFPKGNTTSTLLSPLLACDFTSVNTLELSMKECDLDPSDPHFTKLMASLSSTETLQVTLDTLEFLLALPRPVADVAFPSLRTVIYPDPVNGAESSLVAFLDGRRRIGLPIEVIDLDGGYETINRDFRFLEKVTGLKVTWCVKGEKFEHTCGSGDPEILNILIPRSRFWQ